jgi:hypothetical protein
MRMLVVHPGAPPFRLETSGFEAGVHVAACAACEVRDRCRGLRPDYLAVHGEGVARAVRVGDAGGEGGLVGPPRK